MKLGKSQKTNQFLESLKAEGEVIVEDVQPRLSQSRTAAPPLTDPVTLTVEEKLNVTLKRDGGVGSFDVQGTLSLQILNQEDAHIQVQVMYTYYLSQALCPVAGDLHKQEFIFSKKNELLTCKSCSCFI